MKDVQLKSMKGKLFMISSLTHYRFSLGKIHRNDKTEGAFQRGIFRIYFHNTRIELTSFEPTGTCIYGHRAILENVRQKYLGTYYSNTFNT